MRKNKENENTKKVYCIWTPIHPDIKSICVSECNLLSSIYEKARGNVILLRHRRCPKCGKLIRYEAPEGKE